MDLGLLGAQVILQGVARVGPDTTIFGSISLQTAFTR
jgi:hypothetical protein